MNGLCAASIRARASGSAGRATLARPLPPRATTGTRRCPPRRRTPARPRPRHDRSNACVVIEPVDLGLELLEERRGEGVDGRMVDGDDGDVAVLLDRDEVSHLRRLRRFRLLRELLPQRGLAELPDCGLRDLLDELEALRQPPLREVRREELAQLVVGRRRASAEDAPRAVAPTTCRRAPRSPPPRRCTVPHQRVLERDGRDPLTPDLTRSFERSGSRCTRAARW